MSLIVKGVEILDKTSPYHLNTVDIFIENDGSIGRIGLLDESADQVIDGSGCFASQGWIDMRANFHDPGHEYKEDLATGMLTAQASGFTDIALLPNTSPVIQYKNDIQYLIHTTKSFVAKAHPLAAITKDTLGEELTDMLDLHHAGAIAFTDGEQPLWHTDIVVKTLQYLQHIDGLLINKPHEKWLATSGVMHEGNMSTLLGMRAIPALAEELMIQRDLSLLAYTGGKIHFSCISTAGAVQLIREAKAKGLAVTCDTPIYHLVLEDAHLHDFDTHLKVNPPLRGHEDRMALIAGLKDGTIDAICSNHSPQDLESKRLEFDLAAFGMLSLQTLLPNLISLQDHLSFEQVIEKVTSGPRKIFGMEDCSIVEGSNARITIFNTRQAWRYDNSSNRSKSKNSPWFGQKLTGKVNAIICGNKNFINS